VGKKKTTKQRRRDNADPQITQEFRQDRTELLSLHRTKEGTVLFEGVVAKPGVMTYLQPDGTICREFVPEETLRDADSLATLARKSVVLEHPPGMEDVTPDNVQELGVGDLDSGIVVKENGYVTVKGAIRRRDAIDSLDAKDKIELSPGYVCYVEHSAGSDPVHGDYDAIQRRRVYNHLAMTGGARGGPECRIRMDSSSIRLDVTDLEKIADEFIKKTDPLPTEHAARQADPKGFEPGSFVRKEVRPGVSMVMGKKAGEGKLTVQSIRLSIKHFKGPDDAKKWLEQNNFSVGQFEAAQPKNDGAPNNTGPTPPTPPQRGDHMNPILEALVGVLRGDMDAASAKAAVGAVRGDASMTDIERGAVQKALDEFSLSAAKAQKERDEMKGKLDEFMAQAEQKKKDAADAETPEAKAKRDADEHAAFMAKFAERAPLVQVATAHKVDAAELDKMTNDQIMRAVVEKASGAEIPADHSMDRVRGRYDAIAERHVAAAKADGLSEILNPYKAPKDPGTQHADAEEDPYDIQMKNLGA
jgi:hypothetical protein